MPPLRLLSLLAAALTTTLAAPAAAECLPGPARFDLPGQRLNERMQALAHRTGCPVVAAASTLSGRHAPALHGRMTTRAAFSRSVRGTGLEATTVDGQWHVGRAAQDRFATRAAMPDRVARRLR